MKAASPLGATPKDHATQTGSGSARDESLAFPLLFLYPPKMPKLDLAQIPTHEGSGYPAPFATPCAQRLRQRLGDAGGLTDFGVNLMRLPPGAWSSQRHTHSAEDEFVYVLSGTLTLIEDEGETLLHPGDAATFPKATGNGHHLVNRGAETATYLEIGTRNPADHTTYPDIDLQVADDGIYKRMDGTPY